MFSGQFLSVCSHQVSKMAGEAVCVFGPRPRTPADAPLGRRHVLYSFCGHHLAAPVVSGVTSRGDTRNLLSCLVTCEQVAESGTNLRTPIRLLSSCGRRRRRSRSSFTTVLVGFKRAKKPIAV